MLRRPSWLLLSLAWAMACGGRYQSSGDDDDPGTGATGQGGSGSAIAGTPGRSGTSSGGKATGGVGGAGGAITTAGAPIMGGVGASGPCACDPILCPPGYLTVPNPDGCCFHCVVDLMRCERARGGYRQLREELLETYRSTACSSDADCTYYYEKNACEATGCPLVVPVTTLMSLTSILDNYAQMSCDGCPPEPAPPCVPPPVGLCRMGRCQ